VKHTVEFLVPEEPRTIPCRTCVLEIPESVAHSLEGTDYVLHFCGLQCYALWRETDEDPRARSS
jgi:hypothetical protein